MEQNIGWNLSRAALSWRHVVDLYMSDLGFTQSRWIAMLHLKRIGEGCTQSELASNIGIEQPSLIRTLNQLCEADYLQRKESEQDARCKTLWFTSKGKEVLQEMQTIADWHNVCLVFINLFLNCCCFDFITGFASGIHIAEQAAHFSGIGLA